MDVIGSFGLFYADDFIKLYNGDCLDVLKTYKDNSIDTIITDPPYGLNFMGIDWDNPRKKSQAGGDLSRGWNHISFQEWTFKWAKECLRVAKPGATMFVFGGTRMFHRIACGIEDSGWIIRDVLMWLYSNGLPKSIGISAFPGYRTHSLKPCWEPILMCMKSNEGSYTDNAVKYGVSGLNFNFDKYPANLFLSCGCGEKHNGDCPVSLLGDKSRFFYCAKASRKEREKGVDLEEVDLYIYKYEYNGRGTPRKKSGTNNHPTVKPVKLMAWLVELTKTPYGGIVLDPFMGSGSTGIACRFFGRPFVGIDSNKRYCEIARQRILNYSEYFDV